MRGKRVPKGVGTPALRDAGPANRVSHRSLEDGLVQVVAPELAGLAVSVDPGRREYPLPDPLPAGVGILAMEGGRQLDPARASGHIVVVLAAGGSEVVGQICLADGDAVLVALAGAQRELVGGEVDVLGARAAALQDAEAGTVEEAGHQPGDAVEPLEYRANLITGEDHRQPDRPLGSHDVVE